MDTQTITQSLAYISWVLLLGIGLGSLALVVLLRQSTDATKGFVGFTAICASLAGLLVWFINDSLPDPAKLHIQAAHELDGPRAVAIGLFTACWRGSWRRRSAPSAEPGGPRMVCRSSSRCWPCRR